MEWEQSPRDESLGPRLVLGLGLLLLVITLAEGLYVSFVANPLGTAWVAGLVTSLPFTLWVVSAGVWLPDSLASVSRFSRVVFWCLGGLGVFLIINISIMLAMPPDSLLHLVSWGRWAATLGAGVGLLVGVFEHRSIERAVHAERERVRAEEAEAREDLLDYLNSLLRHEVLNGVSVIAGHADLALAEYDGHGDVPDHVETIKAHSQELEAVTEDVRLLLLASQDKVAAGQVDIVDLLRKEVDGVRNTHAAVSVETSLPERAIARADEPIRRAFANLLRNAVEHNDSDTPQIEVTVRREPDAVVVQIADNGSGIPEAERETLFEREVRHDDRHGLGLLLTQLLVDNYDGTIELTDTGPDGTVFTLTLPRASDPAPERAESDRQSTESLVSQ
ncbi:MAG: sensor histidine kinase [Haloferacaceae archaeon]